MSPCQTQRHVAKLCGLADDQPYSYLYRDSPLDTSCPPILSGSHSLRYSEYSPTSDHYSQVLTGYIRTHIHLISAGLWRATL